MVASEPMRFPRRRTHPRPPTPRHHPPPRTHLRPRTPRPHPTPPTHPPPSTPPPPPPPPPPPRASPPATPPRGLRRPAHRPPHPRAPGPGAVEQRVEQAPQRRHARPPAGRHHPRRPPLDSPRQRLTRRLGCDPPEQEAGQELLLPLPGALLECPLDHPRVHPPEVGHADPHPVRRKLDPQRPPERLHPRLGHRVGAGQRPVGERVDAGDEHQLPPPGDHRLKPGPDRPVDPEQVDLDHPLPLLGGHPPHRRRAGRDPRIGDHHVHPPEPLARGGDRPRDRRRVGHVRLQSDRAPGPEPRRRLGHLPAVEVDERHRGSPADERAPAGQADPPRPAGDHRHPPGQVEHGVRHYPTPTATTRPRPPLRHPRPLPTPTATTPPRA